MIIISKKKELYENNSKKKYSLIVLSLWATTLLVVYLLFFPVKGDMFGHFIPIYCFLLLSLLLVWLFSTSSSAVVKEVRLKLTVLILSFAVFFPAASYLYNGRMYFVRNSAEFNYPTVLWLTLDQSNDDELDLAIEAANDAENLPLVQWLNDLKSRHSGN